MASAEVMPPGPPFGPPWSQASMQLYGSGQSTPPMPPPMMSSGSGFPPMPSSMSQGPMQPFGSGQSIPPMPPPMTSSGSGFPPMPSSGSFMGGGGASTPPRPPMPSFPGPAPTSYNIATPPGSQQPNPFDSNRMMQPGSMDAYALPGSLGPSLPGGPPNTLGPSFPGYPPGGSPDQSFRTIPPDVVQSLNGRLPSSLGPSFPGAPPDLSSPRGSPLGGSPDESFRNMPVDAMQSMRPPNSMGGMYPPMRPPGGVLARGARGSLDGVAGVDTPFWHDTKAKMPSARGVIETDVSKYDLMLMPLHTRKGPPPLDVPLHVGNRFPVYPAPMTAQYGCYDAVEEEIRRQKKWASKLPPYSSLARAQLRNIADVSNQTFAERYMNAWQWCFIHADGWLINFWTCDQQDPEHPPHFEIARNSHEGENVMPAASIDMRQIFVVHVIKDASSAEGAQCPWELHLNFQRGYLPIRLATENYAKGWEAHIMHAVVENTKMNQMRERDASAILELNNDETESVHMSHHDRARMRSLKDLWYEALKFMQRGMQAPKSVYYGIYRLYDGEGGHSDGNLSLAEIHCMAKELLQVKKAAVKKALLPQEKLLYSNLRSVRSKPKESIRSAVETGRSLLATYEEMADPHEFADRVIAFHARTDISREGRVDPDEFMNAAPIFLMPTPLLLKETEFFTHLDTSAKETKRSVKVVQRKMAGHDPDFKQSKECVQQ